MQVNPYAAPSVGELTQVEAPLPVDELSVTYEINVEDLLAFRMYLYDSSATLRKLRMGRRFRIGLVFGFLALGAISFGDSMTAMYLLATAFISIVVSILRSRRLYLRSMRKYLRSVYAERPNRGLRGSHQLIVHSSGIEARAQLSTEISQWSAIAEIAEADHHLFFIVTSETAHTIPKQAFSTPEAMIRFRDAARRWHAAALGGSPFAPAS